MQFPRVGVVRRGRGEGVGSAGVGGGGVGGQGVDGVGGEGEAQGFVFAVQEEVLLEGEGAGGGGGEGVVAEGHGGFVMWDFVSFCGFVLREGLDGLRCVFLWRFVRDWLGLRCVSRSLL